MKPTLPEKVGAKSPHKTSPGGSTKPSGSSPSFNRSHFVNGQFEINRYAIPFSNIPKTLQPLCHWLVVPSTTIPDSILQHVNADLATYLRENAKTDSVESRYHLEHRPTRASKSTAEEDAAGSESEAEPESGPKAEPWPVVTLDKTWEEHYRLMLISIYPLAAELGAEGMLATESTWRSYVYAPSELLLLNNPLLTVESNSEVRARPWRLSPRWLEDARPDATLGLKAITEHADVAACATRRISFSFADIKEKRSKDNNDESKLLVIMGIRLWHLKQAIPSTHLWEMMDNGIPLYVSVGVLRSAVSWFVYFMWRELEPSTEKPIFRWSRLLDGPSLSTPEGFLHYTTFMWRLSVYGGLFARAVREQLRARKEVIKSHESTSAQDDQRDGDDGDDGDDDDGDGDDGDGGAKERKSVGDRSGSSGSSKDQRDRNASGDTVTDLTDAVLLSKGGGIEVVLGRAPGSGELLVRKTMETFIDINNTNEFKAYMILQGKGLAPRLLGHRSYGEDYVELDLEYLPPYTINPRDGSEMKLYARGLLQALAGIHELGLMHLDIKSDNIIVSHVDGKGLQVKLIDFEFSLTPGSSPDDVVCCGTPGYCAPEISQAERDRDYTAVLRNGGAADVFAAGLVLLEDLLDIQYLYDHQRESEALTAYLAQLMAEDLSHKERCARLRSKLKALKMKRGKRPPVVLLGEEAGAMALDLVHKLTQHSVSARYTAAQALAHPFVADAGTLHPSVADAVPHHRSISL